MASQATLVGEKIVTTNQLTFQSIVVKTMVVHTITYMVFGLLAFTIFDYSTQFAETDLRLLMRQTDHPLVMAGPLLQPIRGFLFGIAFYLLREVLFGRKYGWLTLWIVLVIMGILSTFGPSPGSIEGMIYTIFPILSHVSGGLLEVCLQALALSVLVCYWVNHPEKRWLSWVLGALFVITLLLPSLGLLMEYLS